MLVKWFVRFVLVVVLVSVGVLPLSASYTAQTACDSSVDQLTVGATAFAAGQYANAIAAYECVLTVNDPDPQTIVALADAYLLDGQFVAATSIYNAAFDRDLEVSSGVSFEAAETTRRDLAVETVPDDVNAHFLRGAWLWAIARDDIALSDYQTILDIQPNHVGALAFQGSSKAYLGDMDGANEAWDRARELGVNNPHVFALIANTMLGIGEPESAYSALTRSLELAPDDIYILMVEARYFEMIGSWEHAIEVLEQILPRALPVMWRIPVRLGIAYLHSGDDETAETQFTEIEQREPNNPWVDYEIALAYGGIDEVIAADYMYRSAQHFGATLADTTAITVDEPLTLEMIYRRGYRLAFEAQMGQVLTLTASADETLDPLIVLVDPDGNAITFSDDVVGNQDLTARINDWIVPADGIYTLFVTHAGLGSEGTTEVSIIASAR